MRIAMWSGPRNLSTAMMYAFAARGDFAVVDEPFYAAYLAKTGLDHPMRSEILASQSTDPNQVIARLTGSNSGKKAHFYQKHMTQHMVFSSSTAWVNDLTNIFLIRHPARVIASYAAKRQNPTLDDLGIQKQLDLFNRLRATGHAPLVIDSHDIRADPEMMLRKLCDAIGLSWEPAMLSWSAGGHKSDGIWAAHWYGAAHRSAGFAGAEGELLNLTGSLADLAAAALPCYRRLAQEKL